jgi:hypothetical protein
MRKKKVDRFPGFELVTGPESGVETFGTNVWVRKEPFGVIIVFPAGQTLKILPEEECKNDTK